MSDKAAILRAARRYGSDPAFDRKMRQQYHVSGPAILIKLAKGESGFNMKAVSSAGARAATQFMPGTRADYVKRYGIDPWRTPEEAVHAAKIYLQKSGLASYNPGMPSYSRYILGQKIGNVAHAGSLSHESSRSADRGTPGVAGTMSYSATQTQASDQPSRRAAALMVLQHSGKHLPKVGGASKLAQADYLFKTGQATERVPGSYSGKTTLTPSRPGREPAVDDEPAITPGRGKFKISGPNPGRLKPELVAFARKVAGVAGETLVGLDGSTHSKFTVNGNVSEHWTGNATDIPARGTRLVHLGQAALIAAGMPRKQALKQTGGLFNVGNHQIIFNTHEGGDHTDHLHISTHAKR